MSAACERYDDLIRLYILPTLGVMLASKLDAELLERFYARLHRCRELCTGRPRAGHVCRPLSTSTTRKIHYIIRGVLERAVRWQHLRVNKAAMAETRCFLWLSTTAPCTHSRIVCPDTAA